MTEKQVRQGKQGKAPVPSRRQFLEAIKRCDGYPHAVRNKAIIVTIFATGLRPKEATSVLLKDVWDFQSNSLHDELILISAYTKRQKTRALPLHNELLIEHLTTYIKERLSGKERHAKPASPLFLSQKGGPFSPNSFGNLMNKLLEKRANIRRASSYSGRRYFATSTISNGVDPNSVKTLMGHTKLSTTEIYFESHPDRLSDAMKNVV